MNKRIAAVGGAIAIVALVLVYLRCGRDHKATSSAGTQTRGSLALHGAAAQRDAIVIPPWMIQTGAPARRVAGKVVFAAAPVAGATVRLALQTEFGVLQPIAEKRTGADGTFDFGAQPAAMFTVSAEAPQRKAASVNVAVGDPRAKPDHLVLELGDCGTRLYGAVLDASGGPIAKAHLMSAGLAGAESDASGQYNLCIDADRAQVRIEADGYGSIQVFIHLFGALHYDFVLVPEAVLVGQVITETKRPVAGAHVLAMPDPGEGPHHLSAGWAIADGDGRFRIPGLAPGHYRLTAAAEGLDTPAHVPAIARPGTSAREVIIVVKTVARVRGRVVMGGKPVVGAAVAADRSGQRASGIAYSQQDGTFTLVDVPLGVTGFTALPYEVKTPKTLAVTANVDNLTLEVGKLAAVRGHVTRHGKPMPGAQVGCNQPVCPVTADDQGAYVVEGLPAGEVRMLAWHTVGRAFTPDKKIALAPGEDKTVDWELDRAGQAKGVVVDESGKPVPGVYVRMHNEDDTDIGESMTDASGQFDCGTMAGGDYIPVVYPTPMAGQAFAPATGDRFPAIKVPQDGAVAGIKLAIKYERLTISGTVLDDAGAPVADVHIEALGRGRGGMDLPSIMSAANGRFAIGNLARGVYNLHAHAGDGSEGDVSDVAAGTDGVVVKLIRPGAIEGTLAGFSVQPVVEVLTLTSNLRIGTIAIVEGNKFWATGLRPGRYTVQARAGNELDGTTVEVKSGQTARAALSSRGLGKVEGTVREFQTKTPLAGMQCDANLSMGGQMGGGGPPNPETHAVSDAKGHFAMAAPIGRVRVICFPSEPGLSVAGTDVDVTKASVASVDVLSVRNKFGNSPGDAGFRVTPLTLPLVINPVTAAAAQGVRVGDLLVTIDGASLAGVLPMGAMFLIANHKPGTTVTIGVDRGGTPLTFKLPVVAAPD